MTPSPEKLGLFVPAGLHEKMIQAALRLGRKSPRGTVRRVYERAFTQLADALDAGDAVGFPAIRGAKDRVSVRLSRRLCARLRAHMRSRNLKLTDLAYAAIDRFLAEEGVGRGPPAQHHPRPRQDRDRREDDRCPLEVEGQARR